MRLRVDWELVDSLIFNSFIWLQVGNMAACYVCRIGLMSWKVLLRLVSAGAQCSNTGQCGGLRLSLGQLPGSTEHCVFVLLPVAPACT